MAFWILMTLAFVSIAWSLFRSRHERAVLREARASHVGVIGSLIGMAVMQVDGAFATIAGITILLPSLVVSLRASRAQMAKRYPALERSPSNFLMSPPEALLGAADAEDREEQRRRDALAARAFCPSSCVDHSGVVGWRLNWYAAALMAIPMLVINIVTFAYVGRPLLKKPDADHLSAGH